MEQDRIASIQRTNRKLPEMLRQINRLPPIIRHLLPSSYPHLYLTTQPSTQLRHQLALRGGGSRGLRPWRVCSQGIVAWAGRRFGACSLSSATSWAERMELLGLHVASVAVNSETVKLLEHTIATSEEANVQ